MNRVFVLEEIISDIRNLIAQSVIHEEQLVAALADLAENHFGPKRCLKKKTKQNEFCLRSMYGSEIASPIGNISNLSISAWCSRRNGQVNPNVTLLNLSPGDYVCFLHHRRNNVFYGYIILGDKVAKFNNIRLRGGLRRNHLIKSANGFLVGAFSLANPGSGTSLITRHLFSLSGY